MTQIILPSWVRSVPSGPTLRCLQCGAKFDMDHTGQYQRHVVACAKAHEEEIRAMSPRTQLPGFFGPDAGIPDLEKWTRENRVAILEGRKKLGSKRFVPPPDFTDRDLDEFK